MNKTQLIIAWIMAILLSLVSIGFGLPGFGYGGELYVLVIPIFLIGGMGVYTAGRKRKKDK